MTSDYLPHIIELRRKLIQFSLAFVSIFLILIPFSNKTYQFLSAPLLKYLPEDGHLIATQVTSTFTAPLKLSLFVTLMITIPFGIYQFWSFVVPGLYKKERQMIFPLLFYSIGLFYLGVLFAFAVVCPLALRFFTHIAPANVTVMTDIHHYLSFMLRLMCAFGFAFQIPLITYLLICLRIVPIEKFENLRPYIVVMAFVLGMILTPPDVISQVLLAVPLWFLFEIGVWVGKVKLRKGKTKQSPTV